LLKQFPYISGFRVNDSSTKIQIIDSHSESPNLHVSNVPQPSYRKILEAKQEMLWNKLKYIYIEEAVEEWISTIQNPCTRKSYENSMQELIDRKFLDPHMSLQFYSLLSPEKIIDNLKTSPIFIKDKQGNTTSLQWSIRTREARISCFLAFTRYLSRKTEGIIRRGIPSKEGIEKTFSPKPRKVKTEALTRSQLVLFFEELEKINSRDAMIAKLCLHGAKRISEVLSLKTDQINYEKRQITFKQSKSKIADDFTIISFEKTSARIFLEELKNYIGQRTGLVFITSHSCPIQKTQVDRNFSKAGKRAGIAFRVSPHNLRATAVTLWKEDGFSDSLIMHATGHASSSMVNCYDRSDIANNVTKKSSLL
jgi:integrase/recombinase XerD